MSAEVSDGSQKSEKKVSLVSRLKSMSRIRRGIEFFLLLGYLWNHPRRWVTRSVLAITVSACMIYGWGIHFFWKTYLRDPQSEHAKVVEAYVEEEMESSDSGNGLFEVVSAIPKSIRERQDGVMEQDHDLLDADAIQGRSIASFFEERDLEAEKTGRYFELEGLVATTTHRGPDREKTVMMNLAFEVNTNRGLKELKEKKAEIVSTVQSLLADRNAREIDDVNLRSQLKADLQKEINHFLVHGKVTDVLITAIVTR